MTKQHNTETMTHIDLMIHWCKQFELARVNWIKASNPSTPRETIRKLMQEAAAYASFAITNAEQAGLHVPSVLAVEHEFVKMNNQRIAEEASA